MATATASKAHPVLSPEQVKRRRAEAVRMAVRQYEEARALNVSVADAYKGANADFTQPDYVSLLMVSWAENSLLMVILAHQIAELGLPCPEQVIRTVTRPAGVVVDGKAYLALPDPEDVRDVPCGSAVGRGVQLHVLDLADLEQIG